MENLDGKLDFTYDDPCRGDLVDPHVERVDQRYTGPLIANDALAGDADKLPELAQARHSVFSGIAGKAFGMIGGNLSLQSLHLYRPPGMQAGRSWLRRCDLRIAAKSRRTES